MSADTKHSAQISVPFREVIAAGRKPAVIQNRIERFRYSVAQTVVELEVKASAVKVVIVIEEPVGEPHIVLAGGFSVIIDGLTDMYVTTKDRLDPQTDVIPSGTCIEEFPVNCRRRHPLNPSPYSGNLPAATLPP